MKKYDKIVEDVISMPNTLPQNVIGLQGMSGTLVRSFLNNLVKTVPNVRYLEIGVWKGSTCISALYGNIEKIDKYWLLDNWSEFGGPKTEFIQNFSNVVGSSPNLFDLDCFGVNPIELGIDKVNIYFYDGRHLPRDQEMAIEKYIDSMDDEFIFIIDDWNSDFVKTPTVNAIKKLPLEIVYFREFITGGDAADTWWNGIGIFVLRKTEAQS